MAADLPTLRLWCAEYVMGWKWFEYEGGTRYFRTPDNFTYGAIDVPGHEILFFDALPDYPNDISAAWPVAEKMRIMVRPSPIKGYVAARFLRFYLDGKWEGDCEAQDDTAPCAIIRAALLAVAEKDGQDGR